MASTDRFRAVYGHRCCRAFPMPSLSMVSSFFYWSRSCVPFSLVARRQRLTFETLNPDEGRDWPSLPRNARTTRCSERGSIIKENEGQKKSPLDLMPAGPLAVSFVVLSLFYYLSFLCTTEKFFSVLVSFIVLLDTRSDSGEMRDSIVVMDETPAGPR